MSDPISEMRAGWETEVPDLDTSAMATVAMLNRATALIRRGLENRMSEVGPSLAEFDVLSTLRRSGAPYEMKPSALASATLLSPSGMTHRLDRLEEAGLLERVADPTSRRTAPVRLTATGVAEAESLAREVVAVETAALASLTDSQNVRLDKLLAELLDHLSNDPEFRRS